MPVIQGRKVIFNRTEVSAFRRQWPACELRDRAYWFEFDTIGDLIDTDVPEQDDGVAASAMADDARAYLIDDEQPAWLVM